MDPVSQGIVGAAFAQTAARRTQIATVAWYGLAGWLAPDLDVLFQSPADPLVFLEYHRQFTHSLVFIPAGALLVFLVLRFLASRIALLQGLTAFQGYLACLMGYATHGLLDACTSYGTQLFWPFPMRGSPGTACPSSRSSPSRCWCSSSCEPPCESGSTGVPALDAVFPRGGVAAPSGHGGSGTGGEEPGPRTNALTVSRPLPTWCCGRRSTNMAGTTTSMRFGSAPGSGAYPGDRVAKLDLATDFPGLRPDSVQAGTSTVSLVFRRLPHGGGPHAADRRPAVQLPAERSGSHVGHRAELERSRRACGVVGQSTNGQEDSATVREDGPGLDGVPLEDDQAAPP